MFDFCYFKLFVDILSKLKYNSVYSSVASDDGSSKVLPSASAFNWAYLILYG